MEAGRSGAVVAGRDAVEVRTCAGPQAGPGAGAQAGPRVGPRAGAQGVGRVRAGVRAREGQRERTAVGGVRAAAELGLGRAEFARAVQLGIVRAGLRGPGGVRFARAELDRIRSGEGFPHALRDRVETLGAAGAAELLGVGPARFTRLARCGHVTPVGYRINRYRAVVWLYLAAELKEFAGRRPDLLRGGAPAEDRERLAAGEDQRPRRWRGRHVGLLLRRTADPWERAAILASVLPDGEVDGAVPDPAERNRLAGLAPPPPHGHPQAEAAAAVALRLLRAEQPEEVLWYRTSLDFALTGARAQSKETGESGPT